MSDGMVRKWVTALKWLRTNFHGDARLADHHHSLLKTVLKDNDYWSADEFWPIYFLLGQASVAQLVNHNWHYFSWSELCRMLTERVYISNFRRTYWKNVWFLKWQLYVNIRTTVYLTVRSYYLLHVAKRYLTFTFY